MIPSTLGVFSMYYYLQAFTHGSRIMHYSNITRTHSAGEHAISYFQTTCTVVDSFQEAS